MATNSAIPSDQLEKRKNSKKDVLKVGVAQITPIFLNKTATIKKVIWIFTNAPIE